MNEDILQGKWNQVKGQVKSWWGRLTDNDIAQIEGNSEKLLGLLQERYGYSKQEAQNQIVDFLEMVEAKFERQSE
jgi:uncharacterized protein YjbJ (UPF0337 family)